MYAKRVSRRNRAPFKPADPTYARWVELRRQVDNDEATEELLDEWDKINAEWSRRTVLAHPRPTCCETAQKYPSVTFDVELGGKGQPKGMWIAHMHSGLTQEFAQVFSDDKWGRSWYMQIPEAKACPYCGTTLPKMVFVPNKPDVCRSSDHDYCDNCGERLRNCKCLPPSAAFEPER